MHPRRITASSHVLKAHKSRLGRAIIDMDIHDISIEGPRQLPHAMIERRSGSSLSVATSRAWGLRLFSLDMCNSRTPAFHLATCCRFIYAPLACVCVCVLIWSHLSVNKQSENGQCNVYFGPRYICLAGGWQTHTERQQNKLAYCIVFSLFKNNYFAISIILLK